MSLVLRSEKGSKLTISELDSNLTYLEGLNNNSYQDYSIKNVNLFEIFEILSGVTYSLETLKSPIVENFDAQFKGMSDFFTHSEHTDVYTLNFNGIIKAGDTLRSLNYNISEGSIESLGIDEVVNILQDTIDIRSSYSFLSSNDEYTHEIGFTDTLVGFLYGTINISSLDVVSITYSVGGSIM